MRNLKHILEGILDDSDIDDNELISIGIIREGILDVDDDLDIWEISIPEAAAADVQLMRQNVRYSSWKKIDIDTAIKTYCKSGDIVSLRPDLFPYYPPSFVFGPNVIKLLKQSGVRKIEIQGRLRKGELHIYPDGIADFEGLEIDVPGLNIICYCNKHADAWIDNVNINCQGLEIMNGTVHFKGCHIITKTYNDERTGIICHDNADIETDIPVDVYDTEDIDISMRYDCLSSNTLITPLQKLIDAGYIVHKQGALFPPEFLNVHKQPKSIFKQLKWKSDTEVSISIPRNLYINKPDGCICEFEILNKKKSPQYQSDKFVFLDIPKSNLYCKYLISH